MSRAGLPKRLRYEILRRDNHTCRYCGATAPDARLTVDHVVPVALGGANEAENLVTACVDCNSGKSSMPADAPIVANVSDEALRWGKLMQYASDVQLAERAGREEYLTAFDAAWSGWSANGQPIERDGGWKASLLRFHELGLEIDLIVEAVDIAMGSKAKTENLFSYFCGICWNRYRERIEIARSQMVWEDEQ